MSDQSGGGPITRDDGRIHPWPASILVHTRQMSLKCNPSRVIIRRMGRGGAALATFHHANAGAEVCYGASADWGRVMASLLALIRLGVQPSEVMAALHALAPKEESHG